MRKQAALSSFETSAAEWQLGLVSVIIITKSPAKVLNHKVEGTVGPHLKASVSPLTPTEPAA
jgi:hypothetical protein